MTASGNEFVCGEPTVQIRIKLLPGSAGTTVLAALTKLPGAIDVACRKSAMKIQAKMCGELEAMRIRFIVNLRSLTPNVLGSDAQ
jgi:hypothetical protein